MGTARKPRTTKSRNAPVRTKATSTKWLSGGGEMGGLIRSLDWSATPIGPMESWSPALRMMVRFLLANRFPMLLWWGPDYISIYNDPYRPVLGTKHPWALGTPVRECWSEIWHVLQRLIDTPFKGGPSTWNDDIFLEINRHGFVEETHFTIAYSPVPDDTAESGIGGVLATVVEITDKIIAERRVVALRDLSARPGNARSPHAACVGAARALEAHAKDVPFALLYLIDEDGRTARLAGSAGVTGEADIRPRTIDLQNPSSQGWPIAEAMQRETVQVVDDLATHFRDIPAGPWSDRPSRGIVMRIPSGTPHKPAGVMMAGVSPRSRLDDYYLAFFELIGTQVAAAIANAHSYEVERERAEALAEIDRAKTAFFSNVSHEFRTPLTLILGPVEDTLAESDGPLLSPPRERIEMIRRNGLRLQKLVNTLLDFSRIEAGRVQAAYEAADLAAFTADLASNFQSACDRAGIELVIETAPLQEPVWVDRDMWEKIVLNLMSNAFKFTLEGRIQVSVREANGRAVVSVRDTGSGIPDVEMPKLFDRFHRVEGARGRSQEGSGIGLALVRELVKLHGGDVTAESKLGSGSMFSVSLPFGNRHLPADRLIASTTFPSAGQSASLYVEEAYRWLPDSGHDAPTAVETLDATGAPNETPEPGSRPRVVIADDNSDMRHYLTRLLQDRYELTSAFDGEAAFDIIRKDPPDLVLTDVMMPKLDGFGLLHEIRNDPRTQDVPVIILSARAGDEARIEGLNAGADDYLVKPFGARELLARVQAQLQLSRLRHESRRRLLESQEELADFFDNATVGLHWVGPAGLVQRVNQAELDMLGYSRDEFIGHHIADFHVDRDVIEDILARLDRGEKIHDRQAQMRAKDGTIRDVLISSSALFRDGEFVHTRCITQDITARVRAEKLVSARDMVTRVLARSRTLKEAAPDILHALCTHLGWEVGGLWRVDEAAQVLRCVDIYEEPAGRAPRFAADSRRRTFQPGIGLPGRVWSSAQAAWLPDVVVDDNFPRAAIARGEQLHGAFGFPIRLGDRVVGVIEFFSQEVRSPDFALLEMMAAVGSQVGQFIERWRSAEALIENERYFRTMADTAPAMIWVTDADGKRSFLSRSWFEHTGQAEADALGFGWFQAVHPDDALMCERIFLDSNAKHESFKIEYRLRGRDGQYRWVIDSAQPRFDGYGHFLGYIGSVIDVHEHKLAEEALRDREEMLRVSDRRKDEFLAMLAHELRNPLAPIRNAAQILEHKGPPIPELQWARDVIDRQVDQLTRLVDDLLDVSRITHGVIELRKQRVELREVINDAVEASAPWIARAHHTLSVDMPAEPIPLDADTTRLAQILLNLLNNAAKYTEPGGDIRLDVRRQDNDVIIRVTDNGMGISASMLPHIFDMFAQADGSIDRAQGGLGIGLTLVKRLVSMHGGAIEARSDGPGKGSEFTVRLPIALAADIAAPAAASEGKPAPAAPLRILVVDDNKDAADSMAMFLGMTGHDVRTANDGEAAVEVADAFKPGVVLLDIGLPKLSGYEAAQLMRQKGSNAVLIALTGWGQDEDRRRSREAGFDHHLTKPVAFDDLNRLLADVNESPDPGDPPAT